MEKPKFLINWKTTLTGVLAFIAAVSSEVVTLLDDDPATNPEWKIIIAAGAILFGLAAARDGDKSSEGRKV